MSLFTAMKPTSLHLIALAACLLCAPVFGSSAAEPRKDSDPPPPGEQVDLDPTQLSPQLRAALQPPAPVQHVAPNAPPTAVAAPVPVLPDIVLRALVQTEGKPAAALLEINGKTQQIVSEGTVFSVRGNEHNLLTLTVRKVSADDVEIEAVQLKQTLHVK